MLRTATEPLTAREIAERVLVTANIRRPDKAALADLIGTINSSLRNHDGKGVQRTNEGSPAKWRLSERPLTKNPRQAGMAFQLVVDNPDLTGLKAGFDHIQRLF